MNLATCAATGRLGAGRLSVKILLTGAGGQVGRAFHALAPAGASVAALTHAQLDITDAAEVQRAVLAHAPQWIVNAAAYTAVDAAESAPAVAQALNASAVGFLAQAAQAHRDFLLQTELRF